MSDRLTLENGRVSLSTEEGRTFEASESTLHEALAAIYQPPLNGVLLPDGIKGVFWNDPYLVLVHQLPPMYRPVTWITDDSPEDFGPGTKYRKVLLTFPYAVTFASFVRHRSALQLTGNNELYFSNQPVRSEQDHVCFPALLNVSRIEAGERVRAWICTQNLDGHNASDWCGQLQLLLNHTWNGTFNRSSERHEGESMYRFSTGIHPDLHPIERWEEASRRNRTFALDVAWKPMPLSVGELARTMLAELSREPASALFGPRPRRVGLLTRLARHLQKKSTPQDGEAAT
jgi:hypothetical protein